MIRRGANEQISAEAEAKLSFVAHVGRSRVIGAHMALGLIRGHKNPSKWKRGMGAEERVLLCDTVKGVSQVRNMAAGQSPLPISISSFLAKVSVGFSAFPLFSLPSIHNSVALLSFL